MRLTDVEVELLRSNKKLILSYCNATAKINNLVETNRQQKKGIDRLRRKVAYYRQSCQDLMNTVQKSGYYDILYRSIPDTYTGPKPIPPAEAEIEALRKELDKYKQRAAELAVADYLFGNRQPEKESTENDQ